MTALLAVDPCAFGSARGWHGWAVFDSLGTLAECGATQAAGYPALYSRPSRGIIEKPFVYPGPQPSDPNDLIGVAVSVGVWISTLLIGWETVYPREWKGQVPKNVHNDRVYSVLAPSERAILDALKISKKARTDVLDAIGLGLWKLGRMKQIDPVSRDWCTRCNKFKASAFNVGDLGCKGH